MGAYRRNPHYVAGNNAAAVPWGSGYQLQLPCYAGKENTVQIRTPYHITPEEYDTERRCVMPDVEDVMDAILDTLTPRETRGVRSWMESQLSDAGWLVFSTDNDVRVWALKNTDLVEP